MKIRKELVNQYLKALTMGRAVNFPDPVSDFSNFDADIRTMHKRAYKDGNLDDLRLYLGDLISSPRGRISAFAGQQYPFNEQELVTIFKRAYETIWPEATISNTYDEPLYEFVDMSLEDWEAFSSKSN